MKWPYPLLCLVLLFLAPLSLIRAEGKPLKKIYINPGAWPNFFPEKPYEKDSIEGIFYRIRELARAKGLDILQTDSIEDLGEFEYLIVFEVFSPGRIKKLSQYPKEKLILFLWEPPSVVPENFVLENHQIFSKVYTWHDGLVDNKKYFKFFCPVMNPMISDIPHFSIKRLCALVSANKSSPHPQELYSKRCELVNFFEDISSGDFFLFGTNWPLTFKTYGGPIGKKEETLRWFRFGFAYENIRNVPGYITEKIFDCFRAGTVPVYWGAPNIGETIPQNCFISREDFPDNTSLYAFLKNMDEECYNQYLFNIRTYLSSKEAQLYSRDYFVSLFLDLISTPHE